MQLLAGEMMELQRLSNLAVLYVKADPSDIATQLLDDYTLRSFGRIALQGLGFARLQYVHLAGLRGVTFQSLSYLNAFPRLYSLRLDRLIGEAGHDKRSVQLSCLSQGWAMSNSPRDVLATVVSHGLYLDIADARNKMVLKTLQTPSGEPLDPLLARAHEKLAYTVCQDRQNTPRGDVAQIYVCVSGGHMHDPETWLAVGLAPVSESGNSGSQKGIQSQSKTTRSLKRRRGQDESLRDMLS